MLRVGRGCRPRTGLEVETDKVSGKEGVLGSLLVARFSLGMYQIHRDPQNLVRAAPAGAAARAGGDLQGPGGSQHLCGCGEG